MKTILLMLLLGITFSFANIGTIMVSKGDAQLKRSQKMISVTNGMDIFKGDSIITHKQTMVQVMLNDDTVITIGPDSSFSFLEYFFDGTKKSKIKMRADRGFFRSVTGKIGKVAHENYHVKTQLATIGIRGTDYSVQLGKDSASYICNRGEITLDYAQIQKHLTAGEKAILHLDGLTVKELSSAELANKPKIKELLNKHTNQASITSDTISDVTENKPETTNIKFNCDSK
ncbi:MAG TPA: hypothetical protein ENK68_02200 [Epsilonproteobacteria bacterium]|nr:hypothetical protein [Campylobacterota bacterium]